MGTTVGRTLNAEKLRELARAGADVTLKRLRAEIHRDRTHVPELS